MTWAILTVVFIGLAIVQGIRFRRMYKQETPDWLKHENDMHGGG